MSGMAFAVVVAIAAIGGFIIYEIRKSFQKSSSDKPAPVVPAEFKSKSKTEAYDSPNSSEWTPTPAYDSKLSPTPTVVDTGTLTVSETDTGVAMEYKSDMDKHEELPEYSEVDAGDETPPPSNESYYSDETDEQKDETIPGPPPVMPPVTETETVTEETQTLPVTKEKTKTTKTKKKEKAPEIVVPENYPGKGLGLTHRDYKDIVERLRKGYTITSIADAYEVSRGTIRRIRDSL